MVKAYSAPAAMIKRGGLLRMKSVIVAFPRVVVTKAGERPLWVNRDGLAMSALLPL
jgi:hypothetical protein